MEITAIICAKDEAGTLGGVIDGCGKYASEIIVVDGHSCDQTREVASSKGARVLQDHGLGKGDAIRVGIAAATKDIIVLIDADGSHDPEDIPKLIDPIVQGEADHVTGSRMKGGSDELHGDIGKFIRMVGSDIITLGINYRFGVRLTDSQNGFRALRTDVARMLGTTENITTIEEEMIMNTLKLGFRIAEVPTHEYARKTGQSKIVVSKVAWRYVWCWAKNLLF